MLRLHYSAYRVERFRELLSIKLNQPGVLEIRRGSNRAWTPCRFTGRETGDNFQISSIPIQSRPMPPSHPRTSPGRPNPRLQDTVRLSAQGLAKVMGDLEARVLQTVWEFGKPVPARTVYERVMESHPVAPLTVITVLNKLVTKAFLTRKPEDGLLHYRAVMDEEELRALVSRRVVEGILSFGPDAVAASMVDVLAEQDPERLAELGRLIRRRLHAQRNEQAAVNDA